MYLTELILRSKIFALKNNHPLWYSIFPMDFFLLTVLNHCLCSFCCPVFSLHLFSFLKGKKAGTGIQKARSKYSGNNVKFSFREQKKIIWRLKLGMLNSVVKPLSQIHEALESISSVSKYTYLQRFSKIVSSPLNDLFEDFLVIFRTWSSTPTLC